MDAAKALYDSIRTYRDLERFIDEGEAESLYLECKTQRGVKLARGTIVNFAQALSGFSNTSGGIILWGMDTVREPQTGLDILTQIVPIGNCTAFLRNLKNKVPVLTAPWVPGIEGKIIRKKQSDAQGVVVSYIPQTNGDPVQSLIDKVFYFRAGDQFVEAPFDMIKRLFTSVGSPDIHLNVDKNSIKKKGDNFEVPITLKNEASAMGEYVVIGLEVVNHSDCEFLQCVRFDDASEINPGKRFFSLTLPSTLHKGMNLHVGAIRVKLVGRKRKLTTLATIFAKNMMPRKAKTEIILTKKPKVKIISEMFES